MYEEVEKRSDKAVMGTGQKKNSTTVENSHWNVGNSSLRLKPLHFIQFRKKNDTEKQRYLKTGIENFSSHSMDNSMGKEKETGTNKLRERFQTPIRLISDIVQRCGKPVKTGIEKAKEVAEKILGTPDYSPPDGYCGGRRFMNYGKKLPREGTYYEYDINPFQQGVNRGAERIVIDDDLNVWFTGNHYATFTQIIKKK